MYSRSISSRVFLGFCVSAGNASARLGIRRTGPTLGAYWEKRLTAAQIRFDRACESLERVRKLSARVPGVQINVAAEGGRQVNVA